MQNITHMLKKIWWQKGFAHLDQITKATLCLNLMCKGLTKATIYDKVG